LIKLLLPILFPSWRFFSSIGPSPRVEFGFIASPSQQPKEWILFRPLPERVGFWRGLGRLFHNPQWSERLYINTCAEHLFETPAQFREHEIARRLLAAVAAGEYVAPQNSRYVIYRIRAVFSDERDSTLICDEVVFVAKPVALSAQEQYQ